MRPYILNGTEPLDSVKDIFKDANDNINENQGNPRNKKKHLAPDKYLDIIQANCFSIDIKQSGEYGV